MYFYLTNLLVYVFYQYEYIIHQDFTKNVNNSLLCEKHYTAIPTTPKGAVVAQRFVTGCCLVTNSIEGLSPRVCQIFKENQVMDQKNPLGQLRLKR